MAKHTKAKEEKFVMLPNGMFMDREQFEAIERQFAELRKQFPS